MFDKHSRIRNLEEKLEIRVRESNLEEYWVSSALLDRLERIKPTTYSVLLYVERAKESMFCAECGEYVGQGVWIHAKCEFKIMKPRENFVNFSDDDISSEIDSLYKQAREEEWSGCDWCCGSGAVLESLEDELYHRKRYRELAQQFA